MGKNKNTVKTKIQLETEANLQKSQKKLKRKLEIKKSRKNPTIYCTTNIIRAIDKLDYPKR